MVQKTEVYSRHALKDGGALVRAETLYNVYEKWVCTNLHYFMSIQCIVIWHYSTSLKIWGGGAVAPKTTLVYNLVSTYQKWYSYFNHTTVISVAAAVKVHFNPHTTFYFSHTDVYFLPHWSFALPLKTKYTYYATRRVSAVQWMLVQELEKWWVKSP